MDQNGGNVMSSKRRLYSREFKREAVRLAETRGKMIVDIEVNLGIPQGMLNRWKRKLKGEGDEAFRSQGRLTAVDEELRQLRRENETLRQEREILKKALGTGAVMKLINRVQIALEMKSYAG
jgi:transposase